MNRATVKSTLEELQVFVSIVECGSIVLAAERMQQTASATSRALQRLESKLKVTLLERTTRKIHLTQEGLLFLSKARAILHDLAAAEESLLQSDHDISGLIRVDSATPFVLHVIVPFIAEFMQRYPNIQIELNNHDQVIDLLEHQTDVAIRFGELADSSLHARLLCQSRLYLVASPEYLARYGTPQQAEELLQHDLVGFSQTTHLNHWPIQVKQKPFFAQAKMKASNGETVRQLTLQGLGISCLSQFLVQQDLQAGRLIAILEPHIELHYQKIHAVYYLQQHLPKRVELFIGFMAEKLKDFLADQS